LIATQIVLKQAYESPARASPAPRCRSRVTPFSSRSSRQAFITRAPRPGGRIGRGEEMASRSLVVSTLRTLNQAARILTRKKLSENIKDLAGFVSGQAGERKCVQSPTVDTQGLPDCELLRVSPSCSEWVARLP
jgi:hypothetical protein